MSLVRFIGWGILGLIIGAAIYWVAAYVATAALVFTVGPHVWWSIHQSIAWKLLGAACLGFGVWLMWSHMTGRKAPNRSETENDSSGWSAVAAHQVPEAKVPNVEAFITDQWQALADFASLW
ncbi:MAG: hypothetical protein WB615_11220 [Candidatus Tumulicola sp.]